MLELVDVVAGYGETEVLHGVSLTVEKGTITALIGANGAGKTTTLRCCTGGLHAPSLAGEAQQDDPQAEGCSGRPRASGDPFFQHEKAKQHREQHAALAQGGHIGELGGPHGEQHEQVNLIVAGNAYQFGPSYQPILPLLDLVVSELPMGTLTEGKRAGLYLLARSIIGPKPMIGFPDIFTLAALSAQDYGLWRHWLAEALSCGGTVMLPHNAFTLGGGSFTLPAGEIAPYTRFLRAHPDVYTAEAKSLAGVAVLYDLASTLFDWNAWQSYLDLTKAMQEQHIP